MPPKRVLIAGAGIAGLTAAHYLCQRGFEVTVIESLDTPGGLARSSVTERGIPSEVSWRGTGSWYNCFIRTMQEIPMATETETKTETVYSRSLTKRVHFDLLDKPAGPPGPMEVVRVGSEFARVACSNERSAHEYSTVNARSRLCEMLNCDKKHAYAVIHTIAQTFGPWVGVDWNRASMHQVGKFFQRNLWPNLPSPWVNAAWGQPMGRNSSWAFFNQPINAALFDPWVAFLRQQGVRFRFRTAVARIEAETNMDTTAKVHRVSGLCVRMEGGAPETFVADHYVLAMNPFVTRNIIRDSGLTGGHGRARGKCDAQLRLFEPLTQDGPHIQISFQLAFSERIVLPPAKCHKEGLNHGRGDGVCEASAFILIDSPFDITFVVLDQLFDPRVSSLGPNVVSAWSGTACVSTRQGNVTGKRMEDLTHDEFVAEIKDQVYGSPELAAKVAAANGGRSLCSFPLVALQVWHEWWGRDKVNRARPLRHVLSEYAETAISNPAQGGHTLKWVNSTTNEAFRPTCETGFANLFLAGAHVQTSVSLYSMEGACESGWRAADRISGMEAVPRQRPPPLLEFVQSIDDGLYRNRLPHVLDALLLFLVLIVAMVVVVVLTRKSKSSSSSFSSSSSSQRTQNVFALPLPRPTLPRRVNSLVASTWTVMDQMT